MLARVADGNFSKTIYYNRNAFYITLLFSRLFTFKTNKSNKIRCPKAVPYLDQNSGDGGRELQTTSVAIIISWYYSTNGAPKRG